MYRILIISKEGDGLGIGQRLAQEGCDVDVWVEEERFKEAGKGMVNRVTTWEPASKFADLIILDCVGLGKLEPQLKALNKPILGCSAVLDKIELDRGLGMDLFRKAGIAIPETHNFTSTSEADKIVRSLEWKTGFVIKPNGNVSTAKTMVVKDQKQWDRCLSMISPDSSGIVQRVLNGIEVSTEGWFNGREFLKPMNHTFEEKRFLAGNLGQNTGCMGNVVLNAGEGNNLTKETVERLGGFLAQVGYRGPFDINCIVTDQGAFALEATSRMGYDAVEALAEGLNEPLSDLLYDVALGTRTKMDLTDQTMIAVRLSIPPWPMRKPDKDSLGEPVNGIDEKTIPHLFITDLYRDREGYKTAGGDGVLLKATAIGAPRATDLVGEARKRVYRLLDAISVSSKQYRIDIGERVSDEVKQLKEWGWLNG
jgi:phosphoribosylamine---glycine ligase